MQEDKKHGLKIPNQTLGRPSVREYAQLDKISAVVVLDNVRSMHNVGSIFRTCDAFAMERIVLCGITATPPNREIHKTALGAELSVEWSYVKRTQDAVAELADSGYRVFAIEQVGGAIMLEQFVYDSEQRYAFVFGNEVDGVAQSVVDLCEGSIEIPQVGTKHSLNVAVAAGVVLWSAFKQMFR